MTQKGFETLATAGECNKQKQPPLNSNKARLLFEYQFCKDRTMVAMRSVSSTMPGQFPVMRVEDAVHPSILSLGTQRALLVRRQHHSMRTEGLTPSAALLFHSRMQSPESQSRTRSQSLATDVTRTSAVPSALLLGSEFKAVLEEMLRSPLVQICLWSCRRSVHATYTKLSSASQRHALKSPVMTTGMSEAFQARSTR